MFKMSYTSPQKFKNSLVFPSVSQIPSTSPQVVVVPPQVVVLPSAPKSFNTKIGMNIANLKSTRGCSSCGK